jgi:hypothetical protein
MINQEVLESGWRPGAEQGFAIADRTNQVQGVRGETPVFEIYERDS